LESKATAILALWQFQDLLVDLKIAR
jgi:hypothetical protein